MLTPPKKTTYGFAPASINFHKLISSNGCAVDSSTAVDVDFQVFAYDADEWEETFGQTCRELMAKDDTDELLAKDDTDDQGQDSPVFSQDSD